ncbi:MAG: hypothetical protein HGA44_03405 [Cellulomonadaceae bacterium]|nr:hypothetical protein [Cellulomonadaceae bacterium]
MATEGAGDTGSATAALLQTIPPDDAGAETADRFDWQAAMAAADILSAYLQVVQQGRDNFDEAQVHVELICELHEDWALARGPDAEIVSAKHKETSFGAFTTLNSLLTDGGLLHLYRRWIALGRTPTCRVVTTAGLGGPPRELEEACQLLKAHVRPDASDLPPVVGSLHRALTGALNDDEPSSMEDVTEFLAALRIDHSRPRRDQVSDFAPSGFARPVAETFGKPGAAEAVWEAVLDVVRERMRAARPRRARSLPRVLGARDEEGHERRTLTFAELDVAISVALENARAYSPLPTLRPATRVAVKMTEGGCNVNSVQRAEALRLQYRRYWRGRSTAPGGLAEREAVHNRLRQIADEETEAASNDDRRWGGDLWRRLDQRTTELIEEPDVSGLGSHLLLGGISELANRCEIWFSPRFDVDSALLDSPKKRL